MSAGRLAIAAGVGSATFAFAWWGRNLPFVFSLLAGVTVAAVTLAELAWEARRKRRGSPPSDNEQYWWGRLALLGTIAAALVVSAVAARDAIGLALGVAGVCGAGALLWRFERRERS